MKTKFYYLMMCLFIAFGTPILSSCGDDDDEPVVNTPNTTTNNGDNDNNGNNGGSDNDNNGENNPDAAFIVGQWRYQFGDGYVQWTFNADGKGSYIEIDEGQVDGEDTFTYELNEQDGNVTIYFAHSKAKVVKFTKVSNTEIVIYDFFDSIELWAKMKDGVPQPLNNSFFIGKWKCGDEQNNAVWTLRIGGTGKYVHTVYGREEKYIKLAFVVDNVNSKLSFYYSDMTAESKTYRKISDTEIVVKGESGNEERWLRIE